MSNVDKVLHEMTLETLKYTCPIYVENEYSGYNFVASGILIKNGKEKFLLTASHALNKPSEISYSVGCKNRISFIEGNVMSSNLSKNKFSKIFDVDLLSVKLSQKSRIAIGSTYDFLDISMITSRKKLGKDSLFFLNGFPEKKVSKLKNKTFDIEPLCFITRESSEKNNKKRKINQSTHIMVDYQNNSMKRVSDGEIVLIPELEGMSGSGLWEINTENSKRSLKLIGIISQYRTIGQPSIISTLIDPFKAFLSF